MNETLAEIYGDLAKSYKKLAEYHLSMVSGTKTPQISSLWGQKLPGGEKKSPKEFLTTPKHRAWGGNFAKNAMSYKTKDFVRCDRCGNYWVADSDNRRGWISVSAEQFRAEFRNVLQFIAECVEIINECDDLKTFNENLECNVKPTKWERRHLMDDKLEFNTFKKFCLSEHRRLPSLRG